MTPPTVADAVVHKLIETGLRTVYCLPGLQSDALFNALFDAGKEVRAVHTRHEQAAAYMALGAALATGRPAVYSVVPGPGFLNSTAALATAYTTNARLLCLIGQIPSRAIGRGAGLLHEIPDQSGILRRLTKWADLVASPSEAACKLAKAFVQLTSGRPRPVGLEIPPDILAAPMPATRPCLAAAEADPEPEEEMIQKAADLLASSKHPMIFVGGGALEATAEVRWLAERIQAPVVSYRLGRGVLDDRHPLSLNITGAHRLWKDADVVVAIGTRLQIPLMNWGSDEALKVIRIEIDAPEVSRIKPPAVALIGSAGSVLRRLAPAVDAVAGTRASRIEELRALKEAVARDISILEPQLSYLAAIRSALPENGILVDDLTQLSYVARFAFPVYAPRTYLCSGHQGTLGSGFAIALGAQDARRDVPVVSISGDGGFLYNVQEMATAVQHRIPLVTVVFNDNAFGNVKRMQETLYGNRVIASDLTNPDFVRLAESFGIAAYRVASPELLRATLERTLAARQPALIEVPCGPMPNPFPFFDLPKVRGLS